MERPAPPHLLGLLPEDLLRVLAERGVEITLAQARRIQGAAFSQPRDGGSIDAELISAATRRRNAIGRRLLDAVLEHTDRRRLEIVERVTDPGDGFTKYLLRSPDGALHEAVRIPLHKPGRYTVCLSSQVGCAMQCGFCATGRLGLSRHLAAWEMVAAFIAVRDDTPDGRVTGAVFQGQGEPFHNYDEVIHAARVLSDPNGGRISGPAITISTVGLVPQIRRYAREGHRFRLIVSLTSALPDRRKSLLPVAGNFAIEEVAAAIREYAAVTRGRVTIAWVLMAGVNDGAEEAEAIGRLLGDLPLRLNLIDVNDARPESEGGFRRATDDERGAFMGHLQRLGVPIVRRYSGGASKHAACGMLAATRFE